MAYAKICPACGARNPASASQCNCGEQIEFIEAVSDSECSKSDEFDTRPFRKCAACGHNNFVGDENEYIPGCENCGEDVMNQPLQRLSAIHEPQPDCEGGFFITEIMSNHKFAIPEAGGVIGAEGNIEREFFSQFQYVGGKHIRLLKKEGAWYVQDLGSINRTWLNGEILSPALEYRIEGQGILKIADVVLEFSIE